MVAVVKVFACGPLATNAMLLSGPTGRAALIDPAPSSLALVIDYVEKAAVVVEKILVTHSHWDHIAECAEAKEYFKAPIAIHVGDAGNLRDPGSDGIPTFGIGLIRATEPDLFLEDNQRLLIGDLPLVVLHTPGHSPGSVCFYCEQEKFLICGDLLFAGGGIGTLSLPTAEPDRMWPSLARIGKLPPETVIYPGHGKPTTVGAESWLKGIE
jgi:hydroxyacylglutathione hydrolase